MIQEKINNFLNNEKSMDESFWEDLDLNGFLQAINSSEEDLEKENFKSKHVFQIINNSVMTNPSHPAIAWSLSSMVNEQTNKPIANRAALFRELDIVADIVMRDENHESYLIKMSSNSLVFRHLIEKMGRDNKWLELLKVINLTHQKYKNPQHQKIVNELKLARSSGLNYFIERNIKNFDDKKTLIEQLITPVILNEENYNLKSGFKSLDYSFFTQLSETLFNDSDMSYADKEKLLDIFIEKTMNIEDENIRRFILKNITQHFLKNDDALFEKLIYDLKDKNEKQIFNFYNDTIRYISKSLQFNDANNFENDKPHLNKISLVISMLSEEDVLNIYEDRAKDNDPDTLNAISSFIEKDLKEKALIRALPYFFKIDGCDNLFSDIQKLSLKLTSNSKDVKSKNNLSISSKRTKKM